ncbi:hypothetical protein AB0M83_26990 [Amycolatopsis sp. NPDC051106]|uniref:hypothetical protein n=1 Tax=unclassified Amycolatopsis TaxID=2618356 RepID=UPI00343AAAB0
MEIDDLVNATTTLNNTTGDTAATVMENAMHEARVRGLQALPASIDGEIADSMISRPEF